MPSLDDLGRAFFDTLYDQRIPVAIASGIVAVVGLVVAWRRGWVAAARRHPARSGVVAALVLAVGLPLTWYLASPILIRTALVEALPPAAPATSSAPAAAGASPRSTTGISTPTSAPSAATSATPTAPPIPSSSAFEPSTIATGDFSGTDEFHFGRGTASIIELAPGRYHLRLDDFSVRNGPDLFVYLSPDPGDYTADALELGRLKATDGSFGYDLPEGVDPGRFRSAIIWCKQFSHLFATAPLEGA